MEDKELDKLVEAYINKFNQGYVFYIMSSNEDNKQVLRYCLTHGITQREYDKRFPDDPDIEI